MFTAPRRSLTAILLLTALALSAALALPQNAQARRAWNVDFPHTSVNFEVRHAVVPVTGRFNDFEGAVVFDPDYPEKSSFEFTIPVASIDTRITQRDDHLRSADFFDAGRYPNISFKSTSVRRVARSRYAVRGFLTIKNETREVELPFDYITTRKHPSPQMACTDVTGFTTTFELNRLNFGVGDGSFYAMGLVGVNVDVTIHLQLLAPRPGCSN